MEWNITGNVRTGKINSVKDLCDRLHLICLLDISHVEYRQIVCLYLVYLVIVKNSSEPYNYLNF